MSKLYINGYFLHQQLTGVQRYAREVLTGFDRCGYSYTVLGPSAVFSSNKLAHHFWEQLVLPLKPKEDAVLWSPTNTGPVYAGNHAITLHDVSVFDNPEWFSPYYAHWKRTLIPRIAARAKKIITVSEFSRKNICRHLGVRPDDVRVAYNGVDTNRFKPADNSSVKKTLAKYGISTPYLLTLGSLDPRKNLPRLLEAWNQCVEKDKVNGYVLAVAGGNNGNFRNFKINSSSSVKLLGYVDDHDLPLLYSGATAFLFPSLFEGFGLPVIEAMACGAPVLTSNSTALDEVSGDAAVKVTPEDTDDIRRGILEILASPGLRVTLAARGIERAALFDWNETASAIYGYLTE